MLSTLSTRSSIFFPFSLQGPPVSKPILPLLRPVYTGQLLSFFFFFFFVRHREGELELTTARTREWTLQISSLSSFNDVSRADRRVDYPTFIGARPAKISM